MLVLSRKRNEEIIIGDDISIVVVAIHGGQVRLAVSAPAEVPVPRREVKEAVDRAARDEADRRTAVCWGR